MELRRYWRMRLMMDPDYGLNALTWSFVSTSSERHTSVFFRKLPQLACCQLASAQSVSKCTDYWYVKHVKTQVLSKLSTRKLHYQHSGWTCSCTQTIWESWSISWQKKRKLGEWALHRNTMHCWSHPASGACSMHTYMWSVWCAAGKSQRTATGTCRLRFKTSLPSTLKQ